MAKMDSKTAISIVAALHEHGMRCWLGGGWGVDALVGVQTREHDDLDIAVPTDHEHSAIELLGQQGYAIIRDSDWRPVLLVLVDSSGHRIDVHPIAFDADGNGVQANVGGLPPFRYRKDDLVTGEIDGNQVPCLSARLQLEFHTGYKLSETGRADVALLQSTADSPK